MSAEQTPPARIKSLMAFDFGTQRIGIAIGQRITAGAQPLNPIKARDGIPDWDGLQRLIDEWQPDAFVVGLPLNMDGSAGLRAQASRAFARKPRRCRAEEIANQMQLGTALTLDFLRKKKRTKF